MDRRNFIRASVGFGATLASVGIARAAQMSLGMVPTASGFQAIQRAYVQEPQRVVQECGEWCWAAACAMIFGMWGHPTDQKQIVSKVFHGLPCAPAGALAEPGMVVSDVLSGSWVDQNHQSFQSTLTAAYDSNAGVFDINNATIIQELSDDHPVLYANTTHAMVIVSADYIGSPFAPQIINVIVLDPYPTSLAVHSLSPAELVPATSGGLMTYLGAVQVTDGTS